MLSTPVTLALTFAKWDERSPFEVDLPRAAWPGDYSRNAAVKTCLQGSGSLEAS